MTQVTTVVLALAAGVVYGLNILAVPAWVGLVAVLSALFGMLPVTSDRARLAVAVAEVLLALGLVWLAGEATLERPARLLRDLGWAQALVGLWQCYTHASSLVPRARAGLDRTYGPDALARWRSGDLRFGLELAERVVVRAQPSWVALVLEAAWPEPRPGPVADLLRAGPTATRTELESLLERMSNKGGTERSEARWELARLACEVSIEALSRPETDVGGAAASRFVVAAAAVDGDDERMAQIFAALVVPAVANPAR